MFLQYALMVCLAAFACLVCLSLYFRIRVLRAYHRLIQAEVVFDSSHLFNREKLQNEVLNRYPEQKSDILAFVDGIRLAMRFASLLILIITACAALLIFYPRFNPEG